MTLIFFRSASATTRFFIRRHLLIFPIRHVSTAPLPSHDQISHLILEQKSAVEALHTFKWASKLPDFLHSQSTYRALVHKLCTFRQFDTVHKVLDEMPTSLGSPPDDDILVTLVRGLGRGRRIKEAIKVLDLPVKFGKSPSLKLFNSILDVLVKEDIDLAKKYYKMKMMESGVVGDDYTYGIMMKGLCSTNRIDEGFKLLAAMKSHGRTPSTVIYNTLLNGLCKNKKVGRARSLMNEMGNPNEVTYNILISAYCREENVVQALVMLEKCFDNGITPDVITVTKLVEILCNEGRLNEAVEVLEKMEVKGGKLDVVAYNTLLKGYCMARKSNIAVKFLKGMEMKGYLPDVGTYNTIIRGLFESGDPNKAIDLSHEMKTAGIVWNFETYNVLIAGLCSIGRTDEGLKILELMEEENKRGSCYRIGPYNSIIYGLYKESRLDEAIEFLNKMGKLFPRAVDRTVKILNLCEEGRIEDAKKIYDQMIEEGGIPCAIVYVSLINGLCNRSQAREAFELINDMVSHGCVQIASNLVGSLISCICKEGKVGGAMRLLEDATERGWQLDCGSYWPLIDAMCRNGEFSKASMMLIQMVEKNIVPNYSIWNSMIPCLIRDNNKISIIKCLIRDNPKKMVK
ncbi:pentatricopeptide repeat-containing protein At2g17525, mitochondrial [Impatiens glandulifera]|uniref:pentatricopeptide repeat-containing protein At2g17525, mitochondrial n=1 Tax=Impatiens glandulifera TaxID=253017 RepID=UPI001FB1021D|nr:pentatricopeptide repeat-containing protein At2g17525, mitochondrial [Impatiens glandulifera]